MYCPYHGLDHSPETIFTDEHVLPYSIGGSSQLTIRVCKEANDKCGDGIDGPLVNNFFIAAERLFRNIKGHGGTPPRWDIKGKINNRPAIYSVTPQEKKLTIHPLVTREQKGKDEIVHIECTEDQIETIVGNINKKLDRDKKNPIDLKEFFEGATTEKLENPEMNAESSFDMSVFDRGFVKMALGFSHYFLGENFSRSSDADLLREFLWEENSAKREKKIHGTVWPDQNPELTKILSYKDWHLLALTNKNPVGFHVLLFGKYNGLIKISDDHQKYKKELPVGDGIVFLNNPVDRSLVKYGFKEFISKKFMGKV